MRLPRDFSGDDLAKALTVFGTLSAVLTSVASHLQLSRDEVGRRILGA
jgi:hypothetical protein